MNPIFSLIFLRRRETQSPAQPPPQLSPPSFPLLRLSTSSLPHPYRFGCRPLRCLPFLAPDPELPLALPSPGLFSPPPPRGWQARTAPRRRPPPLRPPQSSNRPVCLALLSFLSVYLPPSRPAVPLFSHHCAQEPSSQSSVTL